MAERPLDESEIDIEIDGETDREADGEVESGPTDQGRPQGAQILPFPTVDRNRQSGTDGDADVRLRDVLGRVLRDERLDQERTLADVAEEANVSLPYLSEVERGVKEVSSDLLDAIADALDLPLDEVLERAVRHIRIGSTRGSGIQMLAA